MIISSKLSKMLRKDEDATSPVVGVIIMIALTVIIAAGATAFASGIIEGVKKTPNAAFALEGAHHGSTSLTILHLGRDTIGAAFTDAPNGQLGAANWGALEVRVNGAAFAETDPGTPTTRLNGATDFGAASFGVGDELRLVLSDSALGALKGGDSISIVYSETGATLGRFTVT